MNKKEIPSNIFVSLIIGVTCLFVLNSAIQCYYKSEIIKKINSAESRIMHELANQNQRIDVRFAEIMVKVLKK